MKVNIPSMIFITGADGVGKTCIARWLVERLLEQGIKAGLVWSRFGNFLSKPLLAITRLSGHNFYKSFDGVLFGFHNFERLYGFRYIFALMQAIDVNISAIKDIRRKKNHYDILVCERGPWDTLADVIADTGLDNLFGSALSRLFTVQIKDGAKVIMVKRSKENIFQSRPELIHDYKLDRKLDIYNRLAAMNRWSIVDNNYSIEATQNDILKLLKLTQKNR
jgi:thymidylate kinase